MEGFEPPVPLRVHLISSQARSTAPAHLQSNAIWHNSLKSVAKIAIEHRKRNNNKDIKTGFYFFNMILK